MERKQASDFPQELLDLFHLYVHGDIDRRAFFDRSAKFAVGGLTVAGLFEALRPNYAWAQQVAKDDARIRTEYATVPSPQGNGSIKGYLARPAAAGKYPAVLVVHENRGLNPYVEDVARRLGTANFIAFAPDGLTSVGGYPGDDERGGQLFGKVDRAKMTEDFIAAINWLKARPESTGRHGVVGFCFGGAISNTLAVQAARARRGGSVLRRRAGGGRRPEDQSGGAGPPRRARHAPRSSMARVRSRAEGEQHPSRRVRVPEGEPRLPQRHDAPLRRGGSEARVAAHARMVQ